MGKIKTEGRVTLEFEPDIYEITITVRAEGKTSGAAVTAGKKQTEQLLQSLQDKLQIKSEQLSAEREAVDKPTHYDQKESDYHFSRTLCLKIPADNKLRESVTDMLAEMDDVTYMITEKLSNENNQKQTALDTAIRIAREKAERIANSLQCEIVGFENILTDGASNIQDEDEEPVRGIVAPSCYKKKAASLKNPKIQITGEVTVVWLTEPLT